MPDQSSALLIDETAETARVEEAERLLRHFCVDPVVDAKGDRFTFRQRIVGDDRLRLASIDVGAGVHLAMGIDAAVAAVSLQSGSLRVTSNGVPVGTESAFLLRPGSVEAWSSGASAQLVSLDLATLANFTGTGGGGALRLDHSAAVDPALERNWRLTVAHAEAVLSDRDLLHNDLIRQITVDSVFAAGATAFGVTTDDRLHSDAPAAVRRAQRYIDERLVTPLSIAEIATAAGLSVRGLQAAFQRSLGTTPARYVRTARLHATRRDLQKSALGSETVGVIARRWGFAHLPRFAQHYRNEFGETPSETLGRMPA
jgi:AraC-like DNA-binding protein